MKFGVIRQSEHTLLSMLFFCVIRFQTALPRLLTFIRFVAVMRIFQSRYKGKYRHWHRHSEVCEHFAVIRKGERNNSVQQI